MTMVGYEMIKLVDEYLKTNEYNDITASDLINGIGNPNVKRAFKHFSDNPVALEKYDEAIACREDVREKMTKYFEENKLDCIVFPTTRQSAT
jgi:hypothetical protein